MNLLTLATIDRVFTIRYQEPQKSVVVYARGDEVRL